MITREEILQHENSLQVENDVSGKNVSSLLAAKLQRLTNFSQFLLDGFLKKVKDLKNYETIIANRLNWGKLCWLDLPSTNMTLLSYAKINDENQLFLEQEYTNQKNIDDLFWHIIRQGLEDVDFKEAINCFKHKYYKACILILFTLIENFFFSRIGNTVNEKRLDKLIYSQNNDQLLLFYAQKLATLTAVKEIYTSGSGFSEDDSNFLAPNRNYISHGLSNRIISDVDCLKVFSVLWNIYSLHFD